MLVGGVPHLFFAMTTLGQHKKSISNLLESTFHSFCWRTNVLHLLD